MLSFDELKLKAVSWVAGPLVLLHSAVRRIQVTSGWLKALAEVIEIMLSPFPT